MTLHTWQSLTADGAVLTLKYSFGFGTANTMAIRSDDGSWLVISPSAGTPDHAFDELAKRGPVRALVANNAYHNLGQAQWRARFPQAVSYAPAGALRRLNKQLPGVPLSSLDSLLSKLPSNISLLQPAGMKQPDLLVRATSGGQTVWFGGDLISNTTAADVNALAGMLFKLLGGGLGYRFNRLPGFVYLRDRKTWLAAVRDAFDGAPPTVVLPGHGDAVTDDVVNRSRAILERAAV